MSPEDCLARQLCFVCLRSSPTCYTPLGPGVIYHPHCLSVIRDTYSSARQPITDQERLALIEAQQVPDGLR